MLFPTQWDINFFINIFFSKCWQKKFSISSHMTEKFYFATSMEYLLNHIVNMDTAKTKDKNNRISESSMVQRRNCSILFWITYLTTEYFEAELCTLNLSDSKAREHNANKRSFSYYVPCNINGIWSCRCITYRLLSSKILQVDS